MTSEELDIAFQNAVKSINEHTEPFPADVLLRLYAYFKRATNADHTRAGGKPHISAFKTNALFQTRGLTSDEAKQLYIESVTQYFLYRK
ncbi:acyl-CoA-binding protein [Aequorivita sublithincola DSM 14238]|uniref:Acyl-CoA-binding protein n=1 Tax=Aequorivita sublithincola (strain DSM 14238 / LMG 21431 / ACAM 643 / 9-3) TaxID=746697 RepID=I3YSI9_AEQSU|nr:acyl-CoA-binding protein [Aequorivita sublithincola]AFL79957.1 acyl-CoA-binding protein [Aequorivita sublithincola DSM 14238]